jgi:hypothetical protein
VDEEAVGQKVVALLAVFAACVHPAVLPRTQAYRTGVCRIYARPGLTNESTTPCTWAFVAPDLELDVQEIAPPPEQDLRGWLAARLDPSAETPGGTLSTDEHDVTCVADGDRVECVKQVSLNRWVRAFARGPDARSAASSAIRSWRIDDP